ncbi:hypothetical protein LCL87_18835 [Rhodococcus hoagii]|nr:hypothetical protein [Prescottella equi]
MYLSLGTDNPQWQLFIEFDEIPADESDGTLLSLLSSDSIEIHGPGTGIHSVPATDLWPGTGRSTVRIGPSRRGTTLRTVGRWPSSVRHRRWEKALAGIPMEGALFARFRGGAFRRVHGHACVRWGDRVILVRSMDSPLPPMVTARRLHPITNQEGTWYAWSIDLPRHEHRGLARWLSGFGAIAVVGSSRTRVLSPAIGYSTDGIPVFAPHEPIVVAPASMGEVLVAESTGSVQAIRTGGALDDKFAVITAAAGPLRLRSKVPQDLVSIEVAARGHRQTEPFASPWSVLADGARLRPFADYTLPRGNTTLALESGLPTLQFTVRVHFSKGRTETLRGAELAAANVWLRTHAESAMQIEIDSGNLGFIRLEFDAERPNEPAPARKTNPHRPNWATAYAIAADQAADASVPHWRAAARSHAGRPLANRALT